MAESGETQDEIRTLLRDMCGKEPPGDADEDLFESGYLDSLLAIKYIAAVEERFNVSVPAEELTPENFGSIAATARTVESLRA